jgi:hypothetical protein
LPRKTVEALGIESEGTYVRNVANRRLDDVNETTKDDERRRGVSALSLGGDPVESALADALKHAAEAGRFDVVAQIARELEARRLARTANVVVLNAKTPRADR